jgi:uncharacterized membrane protein YccC
MSAVEPTAAATTLPVATTHLHILRTTVAAIAAQEIASLVGLPAPYWATMTALVVMQSTLAASWSVSWKRLLGTAIGAIVGGGLAMLLPLCTLTFAVALVATGLLCAFIGLDRVSYRLTGVTLAVVMLAAGSRPASIIAIHRFAEVSIGIVVTLVISAVWPERAGVRQTTIAEVATRAGLTDPRALGLHLWGRGARAPQPSNDTPVQASLFVQSCSASPESIAQGRTP